MNETQRKRRGHAWLPPQVIRRKVPELYGTENVALEDKMIWVHYFSAVGDWYIAEWNLDDAEAFGYVRLAAAPECAEWGYINLNEIEELSAYHGLVIVERDKFWQPVKFSDIKKVH